MLYANEWARQYTDEWLFAWNYLQMNTCQMDDYAKKIGDAVDLAMKAFNGGKGVGQSELSRRSGVPQPTISRILSGKNVPETTTLSKLVAVLGSETLGKTISSLLPKTENSPTMAPLIAKAFALPCEKCGHVSHQSFIDLEMNDTIACPKCGTGIEVARYYGQAQLAEFLESIGATGFVLRKR
jgi:transcriptional regulator with XRE-family HTH domain